jgi:prepilin-type N-terminal cleavage/methylation domain-containing protein
MQSATFARRARQRGLTLLELLLALALGALLMTAVMPMLNGAMAAATDSSTTDQPDLDRQAAFALDRIALAVRATAPTTLVTPIGLIDIFLPPTAPDTTTSGRWFAPSTFQLYGTTLVEKRDGDSVLHVLADSVSSFSIVPLPVTDGRQLVQVDLTLARGKTSTTVTGVVRMGWLQ